MVKTEDVVARVLFWGAVAGVLLMLAGLTAWALDPASGAAALDPRRALENREQGRSVVVFASLDAVARGLRRRPVDPLAVETLGVVVLLATPLGGLAVAIAFFWMEGDRRYTAVAAVVLSIVLLGVVMGRGG